MAQAEAIVAKRLTKSFKNLKVLKGINLNVPKGSILALLGPNGAGKTTTIRILSTLLLPDGGQALISGYDVVEEANEVRHFIGLTGQNVAVDEYLTGRENLIMMGRLYKIEKEAINRRTQELLSQFDLTSAADRVVKTYSGGMRRRLDLAMSLIAAPPILFLDEPTTGLDPRSRLTMWGIIEDLVKAGTTILLTTQYLEEADHLADRIAVLDNGKIIAEGTADQLKRKVGSERVALTFKNEPDLNTASKLIKGKDVHTDASRLTLSLASDGGVHQLQEILSQLKQSNIEVEGLSLHRPTLDDVFLSLTGRGATKAKPAKTKKRGRK